MIAQLIDDDRPDTSGSARTGDARIAETAERALAWNPAVPLDSVRVAVESGWIDLTGTLTWPSQRRAAESAVRHLYGVRGVSNRIMVQREARADDIHDRIARMFRQAAEVSASRVKVEINGPVAILTGVVRSADERREAERVALSTPGISAVEDRLVLVA